MTKIIALTGAAGSGKSTAANILVSNGYSVLKFADPLKNMLRAYYRTLGLSIPYIERCIEGDLKETGDYRLGFKTPRHAMQTLGTEWGRGCLGEDLWVDAWMIRAERSLSPVVVDDCRFPNEAAAVRLLGGKVIKLVGRGGIPGNHASEQGIPGDVEYVNTGSIEDLRSFIRIEAGLAVAA